MSFVPADELLQAVRVHPLLKSSGTIGLRDDLWCRLSFFYLYPQQELHFYHKCLLSSKVEKKKAVADSGNC